MNEFLKKFLAEMGCALFAIGAVFVAVCIIVILGKTAFGLDLNDSVEVSTEELTAVLPEGLSTYAENFIAAAHESNVNVLVLCAISSIESANGRSKLAKLHGNLFGIKNKGRYIWWNDKNGTHADRSIEHAAWFIRKRFLDKGCTTLQAMGETYASSDTWGPAVLDRYYNFLEAINGYRNEDHYEDGDEPGDDTSGTLQGMYVEGQNRMPDGAKVYGCGR